MKTNKFRTNKKDPQNKSHAFNRKIQDPDIIMALTKHHHHKTKLINHKTKLINHHNKLITCKNNINQIKATSFSPFAWLIPTLDKLSS